MIIFTGSDEAVSFTDESSPDSRVTGEKVCINGQVDRTLSLDWYYKIIQFFPDVQGELKSKEVAERFKNFPLTIQKIIWAGLSRVKIHIVDPRSQRHRHNNILRSIWKNDKAPELLSRWEKEGFAHAKYLSNLMRKNIADSILRDSTAARVQFLGRIFLDPFSTVSLDGGKPPFFRASAQQEEMLISVHDFPKERSLIRDVTSWSAKSSAAFHSAMEAALSDESDVFPSGRFMDGEMMRRKMAAQLLPVHAFDDGNRKQLELLDTKRKTVFKELTVNEHVGYLRPAKRGIVPVESRESFYVQAADIAAGIASEIYTQQGLLGVMDKFEYVTHNGVRVSRADAEEEMRKLQSLDL